MQLYVDGKELPIERLFCYRVAKHVVDYLLLNPLFRRLVGSSFGRFD